MTHGDPVDNGAASLESHVGESMGDWYAYTWKTDDKGNYIVGENGLYITDTSERKKVGNAMPKVTGGFGTSLSYKNWTLDAAFDFRFGGDVLNTPWQYYMSVGNIEDALVCVMLQQVVFITMRYRRHLEQGFYPCGKS